MSWATPRGGAGAGVGIGNLGLLTDILFEILGIYGLIISVLTTFPELFDYIVQYSYTFGFGDQVKGAIDGYGCPNNVVKFRM